MCRCLYDLILMLQTHINTYEREVEGRQHEQHDCARSCVDETVLRQQSAGVQVGHLS